MCEQYGITTGLRERLHDLQDWFDPATGKMVGFDYNWWVQFAMSKAEVLGMLKYNLDLRLAGNKAPMIFGAHTDYYNTKYAPGITVSNTERQEAIEEFIKYALSKPEVRIMPYADILKWIKNPTPL
jgi:hypothetical protein